MRCQECCGRYGSRPIPYLKGLTDKLHCIANATTLVLQRLRLVLQNVIVILRNGVLPGLPMFRHGPIGRLRNAHDRERVQLSPLRPDSTLSSQVLPLPVPLLPHLADGGAVVD